MSELEQLKREHEDALLRFETQNRAYFTRTISDRGDEFFERFHDMLEAVLSDQRSGHRLYYVLVEQDGSIVGRFNLYDVQSGGADLGYRVAERVAGHGVATFAVRELCRIARDTHGLTRLTAMASDENLASQRVLEKAGFAVVRPTDVAGRPGKVYTLDLTPGETLADAAC